VCCAVVTVWLGVGSVVPMASVSVVASCFSSCGLIVAFRVLLKGFLISWYSCCLMCVSFHFDFVVLALVCNCLSSFRVFG
jgi:hypothetical protein